MSEINPFQGMMHRRPNVLAEWRKLWYAVLYVASIIGIGYLLTGIR